MYIHNKDRNRYFETLVQSKYVNSIKRLKIIESMKETTVNIYYPPVWNWEQISTEEYFNFVAEYE